MDTAFYKGLTDPPMRPEGRFPVTRGEEGTGCERALRRAAGREGFPGEALPRQNEQEAEERGRSGRKRKAQGAGTCLQCQGICRPLQP